MGNAICNLENKYDTIRDIISKNIFVCLRKVFGQINTKTSEICEKFM